MFNLRNATLIDGKRFTVAGNGGKYRKLELPPGCKLKTNQQPPI